MATGATLDNMMLPLARYKGEQLIYPIGTADYEEITGRKFDLARHNQMARLIYMGKEDDVNLLDYDETYGATEKRIITRLWGKDVLPRAQQLIRLYGQSGGKGIFILDRGVKHSYSEAMIEYVQTFFAANRDSESPVYPLPQDPKQLEYTLYK